MKRREFLKKLGLSGAAAVVVVIPKALEAEPEYITGEMDPVRATDILANGLRAKPTVEELRMMMKDFLLLPERLDWIGIAAMRYIVIDMVMECKDLVFRGKVLTCPEFKDVMPRYEPILVATP